MPPTGYNKYRHDFAKLIWKTASPKWNFNDARFDRSAASLNNPDHVSIVIHNYRWRLGLADGDQQHDNLEKRLAEAPVITVPTITLEGDANGAPHPDPASYADKFTGKDTHRLIAGGIGHNLPQEAPQAVTEAVVEVDGYRSACARTPQPGHRPASRGPMPCPHPVIREGGSPAASSSPSWAKATSQRRDQEALSDDGAWSRVPAGPADVDAEEPVADGAG